MLGDAHPETAPGGSGWRSSLQSTSNPGAIWTRLIEWHQDGVLWSNTWVTLEEIVLGSAAGALAGP